MALVQSSALLNNTIDAETKQMKAEDVYEAVTTIPYGKSWVPSHMILIRQRYADG